MTAERSLLQESHAEGLRPYIPIKKLSFEGGDRQFEYYFVQAPLGLRPDSYDPVRVFVQDLVSYFIARLGCVHESFIQIGQVRDQEVTRLFASKARSWAPETGLGVWPDRPAPRMLQMKDMEEIESPSSRGPLLNSVFRVTAHANARLDAMSTMLGTGCGLQLISQREGAVLLQNLKELFLGFIQDRVFRIFPWYVPLVGKAALTKPIETFTANVLRGIDVYIRESPEDGGILIVSAQPLAEIIERLGYEQMDRETQPVWTLAE